MWSAPSSSSLSFSELDDFSMNIQPFECFWCFVRFHFEMNFYLHLKHLKGFTPKWPLICTSKLDLVPYFFVQNSQLNLNWFSWAALKWSLNVHSYLKSFPQPSKSHTCFSSDFSAWRALCRIRCYSILNDLLQPGWTQWWFLLDRCLLQCCFSSIGVWNIILQLLKMHGKSSVLILFFGIGIWSFITMKFPSNSKYDFSSVSFLTGSL